MLQTTLSDDHFTTFNTFFRAMLGDLTIYDELEVDYYYSLWIFFFSSSIILTIVLLNLLIAIISDTFGAVKANEVLARHFEITNVLYDIDAELYIEKPIEYYTFVYAESENKNKGLGPVEILKEKISEAIQKIKSIDYNLRMIVSKKSKGFHDQK